MESNIKRNELEKRVYQWVLDLLKCAQSLPKDVSTQVIAKQLIRSGTSVGANYVEAQAASSRKDFANFLHYALKSADESRYWLTLLRDLGSGDAQKCEKLYHEIIEVANILGASLRTLKQREVK